MGPSTAEMRVDETVATLAASMAVWTVAETDKLKAVPSAERKADSSAANWVEQMAEKSV